MDEVPARFREAVRKQQIEFVCRTIKAQLVANYTVGVALIWLLKDIYPLSNLYTWFACMVVIYLIRFGTLKIYQHSGITFRMLGIGWEVWFNIANLLGGLVWGYAFFAFYSPDHLAESMLITALTVGFVAGSMGSHLAYFPAFAVYSTTALGLMVLRLALDGSRIETIVAVLGVFYYIVMITAGRASQNLVKQAIVARLQVEELNQELVRQRGELISARDTAEKANMAKSKFLATASHDLRQPLHALRLFVDVLAERAQGNLIIPVVKKIATTTDALEGLFSNLLELARVDAKVTQPQFAAVSLIEIIKDIYVESEPMAQNKGLRIRMRCRDLCIQTDVTILTRILRNFVSNAIRYTDRGGIHIGCRIRGDKVRVEVRDTGVGIPAEHIPMVFQEFHQVANLGRDRTKGLGLGLAIAERLAGLLGTSVEVWSEEGRGSCFSITIPIVDKEQLVISPRPQTLVPTPSITGLRVVLVDDEQDIRDAMVELLDNWGCEYAMGEDLAGALQQMDEWNASPDIIVMDYRLGNGVPGTQVIAEIRERFGWQIPAIIVTGDTSPERLKDAMGSGAAVLHKPIKAIRLRMLIEQLTATRKIA